MKKFIKYIILKSKGAHIKYSECDRISIYSNISKSAKIFGKVEIGAETNMGDHSYINDGTRFLSGSIGRFCSIGYDSIIGPDEHPTNHIFSHPIVYGEYDKKYKKFEFKQKNGPLIEDNVWIGARSIVLRGITIGEGAIIAANSVVVKDVEPYEIVGGIPAKTIKNRKDFHNLSPEALKDMTTEEILKYIHEL